jgi:hypothetical protein
MIATRLTPWCSLTPAGLILVEIKSRPGTLQGDAHTWTRTTDGRQISDDNPLLLTNRKAKRLAANAVSENGFVMTCMPSSSRPLPAVDALRARGLEKAHRR